MAEELLGLLPFETKAIIAMEGRGICRETIGEISLSPSCVAFELAGEFEALDSLILQRPSTLLPKFAVIQLGVLQACYYLCHTWQTLSSYGHAYLHFVLCHDNCLGVPAPTPL